MRDTHATGTGSIMGAGTAGYCVGNLQLDGATLPHEDPEFVYPDNLASPQQVHNTCMYILECRRFGGECHQCFSDDGLESGLEAVQERGVLRH